VIQYVALNGGSFGGREFLSLLHKATSIRRRGIY